MSAMNEEKKAESLADFKLEKILGIVPMSKKIFLKGSFPNSDDIAVVILEKETYTADDFPGVFDESVPAKILFKNDIYLSFKHFPKIDFSGVKATLIYPATDLIVQKYTIVPNLLIDETQKLYEEVTLPYITSHSKSIEWVYNILEHKAESERIIYEDSDPESGFVLLPDLKWNGVTLEDFYLQALPHKRDIKSLRDLTADHLPLLRKIATKGPEVIKEKYNIDKNQLQLYLHYHPSFYHLHVHFTAVGCINRGTGVERAHLLTSVIQNIELLPDYYKRITLPVSLQTSSELLKLLQDASIAANGNPSPIASV